MLGGVHTGAQRTYCQKKSHIRRLVDIVRNGKDHKTCKEILAFQVKGTRAGQVRQAQQIKACAAKPGDQSSNPRTRMVEGENLF